MSAAEAILSPLTGTVEVDLVRTYPVGPLIERWRQDTGIEVTAEFKGVSEFTLHRCRQSQLQFFHPFTLAGSGPLYAQLQKCPWYYMEGKWEHERTLALLGNQGRLLEVGCGEGSFLRQAKAQGLAATGLELNESAIQKAKNNGCEVMNLPVEAAATKFGPSFDVVCCFQVLEHIVHPRPFLESLCQLLKPGGQLVLCVPDGTGWLARNFNILDLPPHHMTRWNGAAFQFLTRILPVELAALEIEPLPRHHARSFMNANLLPWPERDSLPPLQRRLLKTMAKFSAKLLVSSGLHRTLPGQSLFACFRKSRLP